jgi:hypothetical protein
MKTFKAESIFHFSFKNFHLPSPLAMAGDRGALPPRCLALSFTEGTCAPVSWADKSAF